MATKKASAEKLTFNQQLKANLQNPTNYEVKKLGPHKQRRTIIPQDNETRRTISIDNSSDLQMSIEALKLNLTVDELYRQVIWTYLAQ